MHFVCCFFVVCFLNINILAPIIFAFLCYFTVVGVFPFVILKLSRMKGNMMIVGTIPYPDEISIGLASKRGIVITNHHFNLFGSNTFRYPSAINDEWDWTTSPETLKFVWQSSRDAMKRVVAPYSNEIVWSVGYRGRNDESAPCTDCSDEEQGALITQVIGNMSQEWLESDDLKITYMWQEGISLYSQGYLTVPDDVSIVLTDNGNGIIADLNDYAGVSEGIYTHTAMFNSNANQLTEMVSPLRHFNQIGTFSKSSKKNKYAIINTSDLKPVILSTMAVFCYLYNGDGCGTAQEYIRSWVSKHYLLQDAV